MTLADAILVLNQHKHRDYAEWRIGAGGSDQPIAEADFYYNYLEEFEAIAIAEKYVRDNPDLVTNA